MSANVILQPSQKGLRHTEQLVVSSIHTVPDIDDDMAFADLPRTTPPKAAVSSADMSSIMSAWKTASSIG